MSKQLAISAAVSVFAMVACVVMLGAPESGAGAPASAAAPAAVSFGVEAVAGLRTVLQ